MRIVDSEGTSKLGFLRDERQDFDPFCKCFWKTLVSEQLTQPPGRGRDEASLRGQREGFCCSYFRSAFYILFRTEPVRSK